MTELVSDPVAEKFVEIALAPVKQPEILPSVLPLILGLVVIELYFGKHTEESLGWNSSVANAVIWLATGLTLLLSRHAETQLELYASYLLIGIGSFTAYMDFYHKWPSSVAFIASSSSLVYTLAYLSVILVRTDIPVNTASIKASVVLLVSVTLGFKFIQLFEVPSRDRFSSFSR